MVPGPVLAVALAAALTYLAGSVVIHGVKKAGHAIAHVLGKVPHPHRHTTPPEEAPE